MAAIRIRRETHDLVRDLFGALAEDMSFRPCLRVVGEAFDAHVTALHAEQLAVRSGGLELMGEIDGEEFARLDREYATRWAGRNLWIERGIAALLARGWGDGDEVVTRGELHASEYFQRFLQPLDIHHGLGINVQSDGVTSLAILSINRTARAGAFSDEEHQRVAAIRPHLVNAFAIHRRFSTVQSDAATLRSELDALALGVVVLDAGGRIIEANAAAERRLAGTHRIGRGAGGELLLCDAASRARLRLLLEHCAPGTPPPMPDAILVPATARGATPALVLHLCAFPQAGTRVRRGCLLGFLSALGCHAPARLAAGALASAFGLTPAEASVVLSLREHHDPTQVARELGLAVSTVRSHLKHAFRRTGTDRQAELLRLVDRLLDALPA